MIAESHDLLVTKMADGGKINLAKKMSSIYRITSFLIIILSISNARKLSDIQFNPGCKLPECSKDVRNTSHINVAYIQAKGPKDTLHYVMSSVGSTSVLVAMTTDIKATLNIRWADFLSGNMTRIKNSINFTSAVEYAYAVSLNRVLEYNDFKDVARMTEYSAMNESYWRKFPTSAFNWNNSALTSDSDHNTVVFQTRMQDHSNSTKMNSSSPVFMGNGSLALKFQVFNDSSRNPMLPHLAHTNNSCQLDLVLFNISSAFKSARYAVELSLVTTDKASTPMSLKEDTSIDDEYTPGVFKIDDWVVGNGKHQTYIQWKPVSYLSDPASMKASTLARNYGLQNMAKTPQPDILYAYFGDKLVNGQLAARSANVSFGLSMDKFYVKQNYTSWSATIGYGPPPADTLSLLVIIIIAVGIGVPVLLIMGGCIFLCVRKRKDQNDYKPLNADYNTGINSDPVIS